MRRSLKVTIGVLALVFIAILAFQAAVSAGAGKIESSWNHPVPLDGPLAVIDKPGSSVIAGSVNHRFVGLYKGETGELLWRYAPDLFAQGKVVKAVGTSADVNTIAAATASGKIVIFDRYANRLGSFQAALPVAAVAVSGDGAKLAQISDDGRINVSDKFGANGVGIVLGAKPLRVSFNKNGEQLIVATSKALAAWSVAGRKIWSRSVSIKQISIAGNEQAVAVVTGAGQLRLYAGSGRLLWTYGGDRSSPKFNSAAVAKSGDRIAATGDDKLFLFTGAGELINTYETAVKQSRALGFAGDGAVLISDGRNGLTGLSVGEALNRASLWRQTSQWSYPALLAILSLILLNFFALRRLAQPVVVSEVVEFPRRGHEPGKRKAA